jgi:hypothetical protein
MRKTRDQVIDELTRATDLVRAMGDEEFEAYLNACELLEIGIEYCLMAGYMDGEIAAIGNATEGREMVTFLCHYDNTEGGVSDSPFSIFRS